jgi:hypothetical protein
VDRAAPSRPSGITVSAALLHVLNLLTVIFIRWGERDSPALAALIVLYIIFTALVIHACWQGQSWARWIILVRSALMLATFKVLALEGHLHLVQGVAERVLALILIVYLNSARVRAWFARNSRG